MPSRRPGAPPHFGHQGGGGYASSLLDHRFDFQASRAKLSNKIGFEIGNTNAHENVKAAKLHALPPKTAIRNIPAVGMSVAVHDKRKVRDAGLWLRASSRLAVFCEGCL